MQLEPGTLVGQYRIISLLGEGGMGTVWYAEHVVLGTPAAIKVLHPFIARNPDLVQRFINEARIAAHMKHRNVVDVPDCGIAPGPNVPGAQWYIALEYLHGKSLRKLIAENGGQPFPLPTILHILAEAGNGLHAAHEKHNLVHRDIKPDNLFVTPTDDDPYWVRVLDFGIAKLRDPAGAGGVETQSQTAMGTPAYAAPEQMEESKSVDKTADVWALGIIAFEMVTGALPWGSTTTIAGIIGRHNELKAAKKGPDPRSLRPDVPKKWAQVVLKALDPDPRRRWPTVKAFIGALAEATPMPYSANGMSIVQRFAPELAAASLNSLTVGRPVPGAAHLDSAEIATAPERPARPAPPISISDGVPGSGGTYAAHSPHPMSTSTITGSAGQSVAVPQSGGGSRRTLGIAAAAIGALVVAIVVVVVATGSDSASKAASGGAPDGSLPSARATVDASPAPPPIDARPAMSAVAIVSVPVDAAILVDGVSRGAAPLNLQLPVGARVEIRAELAGHHPASRTVEVGPDPATVRLDLVPVPAVATTTEPTPTTTPGTGSSGSQRDGKPRGTGKGSGGSGKGGGTGKGTGTQTGTATGQGTGKGTATGKPFDPDDVL